MHRHIHSHRLTIYTTFFLFIFLYYFLSSFFPFLFPLYIPIRESPPPYLLKLVRDSLNFRLVLVIGYSLLTVIIQKMIFVYILWAFQLVEIPSDGFSMFLGGYFALVVASDQMLFISFFTPGSLMPECLYSNPRISRYHSCSSFLHHLNPIIIPSLLNCTIYFLESYIVIFDSMYLTRKEISDGAFIKMFKEVNAKMHNQHG